MKFFLKLLLFVLIASFSTKCSTVKIWLGLMDFKRPKAKIANVEAKQLKHDSVELDVKMEIQNENDFDIVVEKLRYDFYLGEKRIGHGLRNDIVSIKARKTSSLTLPLTVPMRSLVSNVLKIFSNDKNSGNESISVKSRAQFQGPFGSQEETYEKEITLTRLRKLMGI